MTCSNVELTASLLYIFELEIVKFPRFTNIASPWYPALLASTLLLIIVEPIMFIFPLFHITESATPLELDIVVFTIVQLEVLSLLYIVPYMKEESSSTINDVLSITELEIM